MASRNELASTNKQTDESHLVQLGMFFEKRKSLSTKKTKTSVSIHSLKTSDLNYAAVSLVMKIISQKYDKILSPEIAMRPEPPEKP